MKAGKATIPTYALDHFRHVHRTDDQPVPDFGCNKLPSSQYIPGFELYSGRGVAHTVGPLRSDFYRISITVKGTLDMQIGLQHHKLKSRTIAFTFPNQLFYKRITAEASGYYILFNASFLHELLPAKRQTIEFPFLGTAGTPLFQLSKEELENIVTLINQMDIEVRSQKTGRDRATQLLLYLLLLEAKRSYERQKLDQPASIPETYSLTARFQNLVSTHYLKKRKVTDYAQILSVSANHLNKVVKSITGKTASDSIREMLVQEARSLLRYTTATISEIAYQLDFSDPTSFNRFFKEETNETPLTYRKKYKD